MTHEPEFTTAVLNYIDVNLFDSLNGEGTVYKPGEYYGFVPDEETVKLLSECNGAPAPRKVIIQDARLINDSEKPLLSTYNFELIPDRLGVLACGLYSSPDLSLGYSRGYVDSIESLVKDYVQKRLCVNVRFAAVFDLAKRRSGSSNQQEVPLPFIHSDYTNESGVTRLQQQAFSCQDALAPVAFPLLQERFEDETELKEYISGKKRFLIINVWRNADPTRGHIEQDPLAVCDPRTIQKDAWVTYEIFCSKDLSLFEYHISGGDGDEDCSSHKWYYFSRMSVHECLMWISHDSGRKLLSVPHTSFKIQENSGQRKSIEARAFVFLEELND